jgi:hypothetical protein
LQESGADFVDGRQEILLVCFISLCYVRVVVDRIEEERVLRGNGKQETEGLQEQQATEGRKTRAREREEPTERKKERRRSRSRRRGKRPRSSKGKGVGEWKWNERVELR